MRSDLALGAGVPSLRGRRRPGEALVLQVLRACALISIATTAGIVLALAGETIRFFAKVPLISFLTGTRWAPTFEGSSTSFGVLPLLAGTLLVAIIGIAVAIPLGIGIAVYLCEYARPRARKVMKPILEILAGIPTVVLGFFAINLVTGVLLKAVLPGVETFNALSAGIVVGVMLTPTIASLVEDAMHAVPDELRLGAYGLGASKREVALRVVLPAAVSGVAAAVILALARAIGETMIVTIAAGNQPLLSFNPLHAVQTMTAYIVQVSLGDTPAGSVVYRTIFALGSFLFLITLGLNVLTYRVARRFQRTHR